MLWISGEGELLRVMKRSTEMLSYREEREGGAQQIFSAAGVEDDGGGVEEDGQRRHSVRGSSFATYRINIISSSLSRNHHRQQQRWISIVYQATS